MSFEDPNDEALDAGYPDETGSYAGPETAADMEDVSEVAITAPADQTEDIGATDLPSSRLSFGGLSTETQEATHPFRPAEAVDTAEINTYYAIWRSPSQTKRAWLDIEYTLASPDKAPRLDQARDHLDRAIEQNAPHEPDPEDQSAQKFSSGRAEHWFDAQMAKAVLPAFQDRIDHGLVTPETAGKVYWDLVKEIMPDVEFDGDKAESIVAALGARAALLDRPGDFLYPSGPREGNNELHNDKGQVFNHDYYRLENGRKIPVEVKIRASVTDHEAHYDPHISIVRVVNDLGPYLVGQSNMPHRRGEASFIGTLFRHTRQLMDHELTDAVRMRELDLATSALHHRISVNARDKTLSVAYQAERLRRQGQR